MSEAVTNAIVHGYEGTVGTVTLEAKLSGRRLWVEIRDAGCGIPNVAKAMEPLYSTKEAENRSGMGFSFMEAFMDTLEVTSELGRGTRVTMTKIIGRQDYE